MPPRRFALPIIYRRGDGFASFALSVLLHGGIFGVLLYGVYLFPAPAHEEVLPIEAELDRVTASPHVDPAPPPVQSPPQPTPEELAQQKAQDEQKQKDLEAQKQADEQRQQEEVKAAAEKAAADKAAQEKAVAEEAAKQKAEAERVAQEKAKAAKAAQEKAAEAKRQADLKKQLEDEEKSQREADLKRSLAQEEQADAATRAQANELRASWQSAISARIHRAWTEPPVVPQDLRCELHVTQEPDGKVTNVTLGACNADEAVKESIQAAAYKASPLPSPPDPSIFDRNLFLIFKP